MKSCTSMPKARSGGISSCRRLASLTDDWSIVVIGCCRIGCCKLQGQGTPFMIVGTGIDIAEVPRIRQSVERFGQRFLQRIFTPGEMRYCDSKANRFERYAARFAAKEAAMKALGTGWNHGVR